MNRTNLRKRLWQLWRLVSQHPLTSSVVGGILATVFLSLWTSVFGRWATVWGWGVATINTLYY